MFKVARFLIQHKVGVVAIVALGVFALTPDGDAEAEQSKNPWSAQAAKSSADTFGSTQETSFIDDAVAGASDLLEEAGIGGVEDAEEAVGRFGDTAGAVGSANGK